MATAVRMCSRTLRNIYGLNNVQFPQQSLNSLRCMSQEASKSSDQKSQDQPSEDDTNEAVKALEEEKTKLMEKLEDVQDKYKRSLAETENVRNRMQKQINDAKLFGIQGFCKDLLEVADILSKANESVPKDEVTNGNPHLKNLFEGLTMTETQLTKVFTRNGLEMINPAEGVKFDPNIHEALFEQPVPDKEPGTVAVVTKVGYKLHNRTIRPALVGVFKAA
ncbi:hypothetical protein CAPTEDRAFT_165833, partial [Capitella teleta]